MSEENKAEESESKSNSNGRAFEYITSVRLYEAILAKRGAELEESSTLCKAREAWQKMSDEERSSMDNSAKTLAIAIFDLEPKICQDDGDALVIKLQPDAKGMHGDVRDILLERKKANWEVGFSLKNNHFAVKHSRLARKLDFGAKWYGCPCSQKYWDAIAPIFDRLTTLKNQHALWDELPNKSEEIYRPLLEAFCQEIRDRAAEMPDLPQRVVSYMIGEFDFYKVINLTNRKAVQIMGVNIHGTLNKAAGRQKPRHVMERVKLPTRLFHVGLKPDSDNYAEMIFDGGWQFELRIHNASKRVEPSLKFDIQLISSHKSIFQMMYFWGTLG